MNMGGCHMGYIQELRDLVGQRPLIMPGANVIVIDKNNRLLLQLRSDKVYQNK